MKAKDIIVGVTGGIAAYKAADLVSQLVKQGAGVHVVMTKAAQQFVTPLTFRTLSGNEVITDLFAPAHPIATVHISLADLADLVIIAPATANIIGKIAAGIADDILTSVVMSTTTPVLIAPAMNDKMYQNAILQANLEKLQSLGYIFIEPEEGWLACGRTGKGRLASTERLLSSIRSVLAGEPIQ